MLEIETRDRQTGTGRQTDKQQTRSAQTNKKSKNTKQSNQAIDHLQPSFKTSDFDLATFQLSDLDGHHRGAIIGRAHKHRQRIGALQLIGAERAIRESAADIGVAVLEEAVLSADGIARVHFAVRARDGLFEVVLILFVVIHYAALS